MKGIRTEKDITKKGKREKDNRRKKEGRRDDHP